MNGYADPLFSTDAMIAVFSTDAALARMLAFEAALARAQAAAGLIPKRAAEAIAQTCAADGFDAAAIVARARSAGSPVIPLVKDLTARVAAIDPDAARYVHLGTTSQDVMDTALVLQLREAVALIDTDLARIARALEALARRHAGTPMLGRTLLQPASPVSFGLKAAQWCAAVRRGRRRLDAAAREAMVLQFGGAVGTLSAYGDRGLALSQALAAELGLVLPAASWHTQRDGLMALAAAVATLSGTLGKTATDVALLMQPEVAEASEPHGHGRGSSSAMPHKRNPVGCMRALAAAKRAPGLLSTLLLAMVQEHERALGGWQAEWSTLPELFCVTAGAADAMAEVSEGLTVDPQAMRVNLERCRGLAFSEALAGALARRLGKAAAQDLVERASRTVLATGKDLAAVARETPEIVRALDADTLAAVFALDTALGSAGVLIERLLAEE